MEVISGDSRSSDEERTILKFDKEEYVAILRIAWLIYEAADAPSGYQLRCPYIA